MNDTNESIYKRFNLTPSIQEEGTIGDGEYHPAAEHAIAYVQQARKNTERWLIIKESMASTSLSGNRLAAICLATMERLENNAPVSDRYILGLAWQLAYMQLADKKDFKVNHTKA